MLLVRPSVRFNALVLFGRRQRQSDSFEPHKLVFTVFFLVMNHKLTLNFYSNSKMDMSGGIDRLEGSVETLI